jgi:uncharacterized lipoprotein YmbA
LGVIVRRWILAISTIMLAGCASLGAEYRMSRLDNVTWAYTRAIEWSDFASAHAATRPVADAAPLDASAYKDIKVTSYDLIGTRSGDNGKSIQRSVRIGYVRLSDMAERSLKLEENWTYSDAEKRWYLSSGFPVFK